MLNPDALVALVDTREQWPLELNLPTERATLPTGDYTLQGMEEDICVERKSLPDLVSCLTSGRERFERELQRMRAYPSRAVVVEAGWHDLATGNYRSRLNPKSATPTVASWTGRFCVPFLFLGNRAYAADFVSYFLLGSAKRLHQRMAKTGFSK